MLITGASSGIGEALAHQFYRAGCRVILAARRQKELERVRDELLRTHTPVSVQHCQAVFILDLQTCLVSHYRNETVIRLSQPISQLSSPLI